MIPYQGICVPENGAMSEVTWSRTSSTIDTPLERIVPPVRPTVIQHKLWLYIRFTPTPAFAPVSRVDVTQLWRDKLSGASHPSSHLPDLGL